MVPEPWQLLAAQSLPGFGPGGPESIAADPAAKIKFDSCMHPVLIRWRVIQKRQPLSIYGEASIKELVIESLLKTNKRKKMIKFIDLKKGQEIKSNQLHPFILCSGKLLESPKQGKGIKKTILINAKGSELGFFDEAGSVYSSQIKLAKVNGNWEKVTHAPA
mgnify:CR=1 FL=1